MKRMLLVDDYSDNLTACFVVLKAMFKYRVDEAVNGLEAFESWQSNDYDLILMDFMPRMDGYEANY